MAIRTHDTEDLVGDIMRYEDGTMDETEAVAFFSRLMKAGMIPHLQGSYGRGAQALVEYGYLSPEGDILIEVVQ